jgi:hypothetical protein
MANIKVRARLYSSVGPILLAAMSLATADAGWAACVFTPALPSTTQTKCIAAVQIPGNPLRSFDISWVNPDRAEYYLADRSNAGIDIIDTQTLKFKSTIGGFIGIINNANGTVNNNVSGPDGVTSHGRWLYAGDGDSTLHVIDLNAPTASATKTTINTGGKTRVDEMALTTDGKLLLAANNAEDPPFGTLFRANGDSPTNTMSSASIITKITVDPAIMPPGAGLSIEQPAWDPKTNRFYTSLPVIANNPPGCNYGQLAGDITCDGGLLVTDPLNPNAVEGAFNQASNTGVVPLHACGPNGATVGPHDNLLLGCTPQNNPSNTTTLVINAKTKNYANIGLITGSDEVWYNKGDNRYYLGASRNCKTPGTICKNVPAAQTPALGVVDGTSVLIETIPQSRASHSVAADSENNRIFVPQVAPVAVVGSGGDDTGVGAGICGGNNGCVAVYQHKVDDDDHEGDDDHKDDRRSER